MTAASEVEQRLHAAADALRAGRPGDARALLAPVIAAQPRLGEARRLSGLALRMQGDLAGAQAELRAAVSADKRQPLAHVSLAEALLAKGDAPGAERAYRSALQLDRRHPGAATGLNQLLLSLGRTEEAAQVTAPLAPSSSDQAVLNAHALALKAWGRLDQALVVNRRMTELAPRSATAEHNLAATLGDLARAEEAEAATARALAKGGNAPETWLVRARALQQLQRLDEAEAAYRQAVERRPTYADAHRELAQLIWMRTEDLGAASAMLDAALRIQLDPVLLQRKVKLLEYAGDMEGAYAAALDGCGRDPSASALATIAARAAVLAGEPEAALAHAQQALALLPDEPAGRLVLCEACLAVGDAARAAELVETLRKAAPLDQYLTALQATAWRLLGDLRYRELCDYAGLVGAHRLDTPDGWPTLSAFLADLKPALERLHPFRTHPLDQSLRHGSQASHLPRADPAIAGLFQAIDGPIRRYIAALGKGRDLVRGRALDGYMVKGAWSVRLRSSGFHTDHVHPQGWLSSACYIDLPRSVAGSAGREGWIKFGEPGAATRPKLGPEHFVEPEPGLLVLFPSYMWHGTVPFSGDQHRLTVAFDLLPAKKS